MSELAVNKNSPYFEIIKLQIISRYIVPFCPPKILNSSKQETEVHYAQFKYHKFTFLQIDNGLRINRNISFKYESPNIGALI